MCTFSCSSFISYSLALILSSAAESSLALASSPGLDGGEDELVEAALNKEA